MKWKNLVYSPKENIVLNIICIQSVFRSSRCSRGLSTSHHIIIPEIKLRGNQNSVRSFQYHIKIRKSLMRNVLRNNKKKKHVVVYQRVWLAVITSSTERRRVCWGGLVVIDLKVKGHGRRSGSHVPAGHLCLLLNRPITEGSWGSWTNKEMTFFMDMSRCTFNLFTFPQGKIFIFSFIFILVTTLPCTSYIQYTAL